MTAVSVTGSRTDSGQFLIGLINLSRYLDGTCDGLRICKRKRKEEEVLGRKQQEKQSMVSRRQEEEPKRKAANPKESSTGRSLRNKVSCCTRQTFHISGVQAQHKVEIEC